MDKYTISGVKKLFGLTSTKIRLARQAETVQLKPKPAPLVNLLSGLRIETVDEVSERLDELKKRMDYNDSNVVSSTVLELMDLVECVKHKFEPKEYCVLVSKEKLIEIEEKMRENTRLNILLMSREIKDGINLYVGEDAPKDAIHYGRVPTTLSNYMAFALASDVLSENMKLKNTFVTQGHGTLILNAIRYAIKCYGAVDETKDIGKITMPHMN